MNWVGSATRSQPATAATTKIDAGATRRRLAKSGWIDAGSLKNIPGRFLSILSWNELELVKVWTCNIYLVSVNKNMPIRIAGMHVECRPIVRPFLVEVEISLG